MSPDNVASSITLGNFTVGRLYRQKKSDMPDSSPTPIFAADSDEIGSVKAMPHGSEKSPEKNLNKIRHSLYMPHGRVKIVANYEENDTQKPQNS